MLSDPQTSGGLLIGLARDEARLALTRLRQAGLAAAIIGEVSPGTGRIAVAGGVERR
jgi:selenide,water dikinase